VSVLLTKTPAQLKLSTLAALCTALRRYLHVRAGEWFARNGARRRPHSTSSKPTAHRMLLARLGW
jgi:hypothetical protein